MSLLDFLFPKKCVGCKKGGEYLCPNCFSQISFDIPTKCLICEKPSIDGLTHPKCQGKFTIDGYVAGVAYKRIMKKLLYQFKYQPYLSDLQTVLGELLYENLIQNEQFTQMLRTKPLLVPIPLSASKLRKRGYNQAELLAKGVGEKFGLQIKTILKRARETKPQYGLSREARMENIRGAFEIVFPVIARPSPQRGSPFRGMSETTKQSYQQARLPRYAHNDDFRTALIVDDVLTTGSTLKEAAKVLKKNGFESVWGMVLTQD